MADNSSTPKPSSSVKLVLLGEAAVGKVGRAYSPCLHSIFFLPFPPNYPWATLLTGASLVRGGCTVPFAIPYPHIQ
jgi:hypothetical protein